MSSSSVSFRSFTVFVDTPTAEGSQQKPKLTPKPLVRSFSESSILSRSFPVPTDKENMNPLTGERVGSASLGKKRKGSISVLAVKTLPSETRTLREKGQEAQPETKKRKSSVSSASGSKPKTKKVSSSKKTGKRPSRKASLLPKLDEENESDREQYKIAQAEIDSKCYDLTVKPLADVSEAYECSGESPVVQNDVFALVKEPSAEPEIRDYFSSTSSLSSFNTSRTLRGTSATVPKTFSTPERRQIYSAFTFTSPSPTSKRLAIMRSTSLPPLEFVETAKTS
ncbi:hypothetical protein D9757_005846 [Collybiopsis confluens]|uniref:Uncharacterized protein n=1 Tax=Collybiopsis confluens TaxID=2823264 RepID=A0A8H5HN48_9AGAR|nr:hypothetical protein D9757_005846 [Collybiopsis confluens]